MPSTRADETVTDLSALIERLAAAGVEFIVIGGIAAVIHGSAHVTYDPLSPDS